MVRICRTFSFPNQVNNVLWHPCIFRGALVVSATGIGEEMKHAAVNAAPAQLRDRRRTRSPEL